MDNSDRVLRLSDLLALLLRGAKTILCFTIVVTLLGTALSLYRMQTRRPASLLSDAQFRYDEAETARQEAEMALKAIDEVQIPSVNKKLETAQAGRDSFLASLDSNPFMSLDSSSAGICRVSFYVDRVSASDTSRSRQSSFQKTVGTMLNYVCLADSDTLSHVCEIIGHGTNNDTVQAFITVTSEDGINEIKVMAYDKDMAQSCVDYLLKTFTERLESIDRDCSLTVLSRYTEDLANNLIHDEQLSLLMQLTDYENAIKESEEELRELNDAHIQLHDDLLLAESKLESARANLENVKLLSEQGKAGAPFFSFRSLARNIILSVVLGLFLGCAVALCMGLLGSKLQSQGSLSGRFSFPLLGLLPGREKKMFNKVIKKLEGESDVDYDVAAQTTAQNLLTVVGERSACIVSSLGKKAADGLLPFLHGRVPVCGDILGDPDAAKALASFDCVVLLEERGRSELSMIDNEAQRVNALGKDIIGIVLT